MSLVNDLLIELDRQADPGKREPKAVLDGLSPAARLRKRRRPSLLLPVLLGGLGIGLLTMGVMELSNPLPSDAPTSLPEVGARRAPEPEVTPASILGPTKNAPDRRAQAERSPYPHAHVGGKSGLRSVSIDTSRSHTRLRFEIAGAIRPEVIESEDARGLDIVIKASALIGPLPTLDLESTPIRSFETSVSEHGLQLSLTFDRALRIQTQSLETTKGTTLFLDLRARDAKEMAQIPGPKPPRRNATQPTPSRVPPVPLATQASTTPPKASTDSIARSDGDRVRIDRKTARRKANEEIAAARAARSTGNLEEADRHFESALRHVPDHREATLERAVLLTKMGHVDQGIESIIRARGASRRDPALAMMHAQLLESNQQRERAIDVLDAAGFSLTEAPDVHALAAAFLQRGGHHAEAINRYETIVRRYPDRAQWWMGLGISLEAEQRRAEATDVYRIAMQIGDLPQPTRSWVSGRITALDEGS